MSEPSLEAMRMRVVIAIAALHTTLLSTPFPDMKALWDASSKVNSTLLALDVYLHELGKQPAPEPIAVARCSADAEFVAGFYEALEARE